MEIRQKENGPAAGGFSLPAGSQTDTHTHAHTYTHTQTHTHKTHTAARASAAVTLVEPASVDPKARYLTNDMVRI